MSEHRTAHDYYRPRERDRLRREDALAAANQAAAAYLQAPSDRLAKRYARSLERISDGLTVEIVDGRSTR